MAPFIVKTVFKGRDLLTPIFKRQSAAVGRFGDKASRSFAKASQSATSFGNVVKGILTAGMIQRSLGALTRGLRVVGEEFIDFDQALTQAGAKFPVVIKRGTESFKKLGAVPRKVGAETEFSAADAARALDFFAMAGFNAAQAMVALPRTTDLATIGNMELARASDIATDTLGAFNLMTKDSIQLEKNLARVIDTMAVMITSSNTNMEDLFETIKMAGPVWTSAGQSMETFNTVLAEMVNAGIKSSIAGVSMRTAVINLSTPVPKAQKLLRKLGIEITNSTGGMRDMLDILEDVRRGTSKMGEVQKTAALNTIFGKRAVAGLLTVLNATDQQMREFRANQEAAGGASKRMAGDIRKSIGNRLKELRSALIEVGFKFIEAFVGKGEGGLDRLIEAVRRFDVKPIVEGVKSVIRVVSVMVDGIKIFAEALMDLSPVIKAVTVAVVAAKVAQWAWNAAMLANPIGILIAAIAAAIVVVVILANKWNSAKATIEMSVIGLRHQILSAFEAIQRGVIIAINAIIEAINQIPGVDIAKLELPDESDKIKRQIELVKARNNLLVAAVKDSKDLQRQALAAREGRLGVQRAEAYRGLTIPEAVRQSREELAPFEQPRSVDPELIRQQVSFEGKIQLAGAEPGTKFSGKTRGAPPIRTEVLGANP